MFVVSSPLCSPQTFQKAEEKEEEAEYELSADEKSPLVQSFSETSLFRRKSTRGSSFASEGKKEEKEKFTDDKDKADEVRGQSRTPPPPLFYLPEPLAIALFCLNG